MSPVRRADGTIIGASKIARDISERKAVEAQLARQAERLTHLNRAALLVSQDLDLERIVQAVTDIATELSGARFGAFFYNVLGDEGESYLLFSLSGAPREAFERFGMPRNTAVFDPTFRGAGTIRSDDIRKDPRYGLSAPHHGMPEGHLPVVSYLAVPVISRSGAVLGGLFFGHDEPAMFNARGRGACRGRGCAGGGGDGQRPSSRGGARRDRGAREGRRGAPAHSRRNAPPGEEHARDGPRRSPRRRFARTPAAERQSFEARVRALFRRARPPHRAPLGHRIGR